MPSFNFYFGGYYIHAVIAALSLWLLVLGISFASYKSLKTRRLKLACIESSQIVTLLQLSGFSFLGLTIGILAGYSRESVVDAVIPALLSLIGGFTIYLFETRKKMRLTTSSVLILLPLTLLYGAEIGSTKRLEFESNQEIQASTIRVNEHLTKTVLMKAISEGKIRKDVEIKVPKTIEIPD